MYLAYPPLLETIKKFKTSGIELNMGFEVLSILT
jgi:hypothetical protein